MKKIIEFFHNIGRFITDQGYQERQIWVIWITRKASKIHQDKWTKIRFFGWTTIFFDMLSPWFSLLAIIFFALTDWLDGKVARFKGEDGGKKKDLLDGWADKVFAVILLWYWGRIFIGDVKFAMLSLIEGCGNFLVWFFFWAGILKKNEKDIYKHLLVGKIKFSLQIILLFILWFAKNFYPEWNHWPEIIDDSTSLIIVLAVLSVAFKMA